MAKNKRKVSSTQRDKFKIEVAKILKKKGIISKRANLHSGHYISRGVLAKVNQYETAARLGYSAVPVSRAVAQAAKERGYQVVQGNKIIGPSTPQFRNRLKKGELTGVKPVKGGYMEEVTLPHTIYDMRTLSEASLDSLKLPDEQFAFKYKGYESYYAFPNTKMMIDRLLQYKSIVNSFAGEGDSLEDEFQNLVIFRLHRDDISRVMMSPKERERYNRSLRGPRKRKNKKLLDRIAKVRENQEQILAERKKEKNKRKVENIRNDPVRYEKYKALRRKTAKASYDKRKGK